MKYIILLLLNFFLIAQVSAFDHKHKAFDSLLRKHVKNGRVSYNNFKNDSQKLNKYLSSLSGVSRGQYNSFSRKQKLAFLINAYNAFTIKLILKNYPVKSIKKIGGLFTSPWKIKFFSLLGSKRHLDWIEHSNLRVNFNEPRIHFAIVCASIGCPPLENSAFTASNLERKLQKLTKNFLRDTRRNRYDSRKNTLYLSPIFKWFKKDFTREGTVIEFAKTYMGVTIPQNADIEYTYYNWSLNKK